MAWASLPSQAVRREQWSASASVCPRAVGRGAVRVGFPEASTGTGQCAFPDGHGPHHGVPARLTQEEDFRGRALRRVEPMVEADGADVPGAGGLAGDRHALGRSESMVRDSLRGRRQGHGWRAGPLEADRRRCAVGGAALLLVTGESRMSGGSDRQLLPSVCRCQRGRRSSAPQVTTRCRQPIPIFRFPPIARGARCAPSARPTQRCCRRTTRRISLPVRHRDRERLQQPVAALLRHPTRARPAP